MKNIYEKPIADVIVFDCEDIVTVSPSYTVEEDPINGNAYESVQKFK